MINKRTTADDIMEEMMKILKDASGHISWDQFKSAVDKAQTCSDLQIPLNWVYETGKCVMFQDQAEQYLNQKRSLLCK